MSIALNTTARNGILDSGINTLFDSGKLRIYTATKPATPNLAPAGTLLVEIDLPADAFAAAANGAVAKQGTWEQDEASGTGTAAWFRLSAENDDDSEDG